MTEQDNPRTETARKHDDSDLVPEAPTPSASGVSGGDVARDIGSEDERKRAIEGEDAGLTRVNKDEEANRDEATDKPADAR